MRHLAWPFRPFIISTLRHIIGIFRITGQSSTADELRAATMVSRSLLCVVLLGLFVASCAHAMPGEAPTRLCMCYKSTLVALLSRLSCSVPHVYVRWLDGQWWRTFASVGPAITLGRPPCAEACVWEKQTVPGFGGVPISEDATAAAGV